MNSKINHAGYLIDFLVDDFDYDRIENPLIKYLNSKLENYNISELKDWSVEFKAIYRNVDKIYIFRQARSQVDMKYKEIVVHIPIPLKTNIDWGVTENQIVNLKFNPNSKYCESIEIESNSYTNKYDFIIACMKKGIDHAFKKGFTVNKIKIKPINKIKAST